MANIVIIDTRLVAFETYHHRETITELFRIVQNHLTGISNPVIFWTMDEASGSRRRKELYPEYKAQRAEARKKMSTADQRRYKQFNKNYNKLLPILGMVGRPIHIKGLEADDIGNLLCEQFGGTDHTVYMLSSDKDWAANFEYGSNITQIHLKRGYITADTCRAEFKLSASEIIPFQALAGIEKENVKGVFKFGIGRFASIAEKTPNIDDILSTVQTYVDTAKYGCALPEGFDTVQEMYDFNYELLRKVEVKDITPTEAEELNKQANKRTEHTSVEEFEKTILETYEDFYIVTDNMAAFYKLRS